MSQSSSPTPNYVPARMVNEYAYCPRLSYMEWAQGEFAHSADTLDGRFQHRRVDQESGDLRPDADERMHARSVLLSDDELGAIARIDLVEAEGSRATPVDYKRGQAPDIPEGAYEPERIQLCLQGLLLRANGFESDHGILYFAASKRRVSITFTDELTDRTRELLVETRAMADEAEIPPPLEDSPKCPRCSLVGICLPDEVTFLKGQSKHMVRPDDVRRLIPMRDDALPAYVLRQGATIGKSGDNLTVKVKGKLENTIRLLDISSLSLYGNAQVTAQALSVLMDRGIPVCHFSYGGWLRGVTTGQTHKNIELRMKQFAAAMNDRASLELAQDIVSAKIRNGTVMLRRNNPGLHPTALAEMQRLAGFVRSADSLQALLGIEGTAARIYFANFSGMLKTDLAEFDFHARNRRPPADPVNAVLSFLYSMLMRQVVTTLLAVGFDPYLGFYHQPRYGRPSLALDMAEEFRPIVADSVAITLFNNDELKPHDFVKRSGAVSLTQPGRRTVASGFERRMNQTIRHPLFSYSVSYRRILEVQARLLGRHLLGEIGAYPAFTTR